MSDSDYQDGRLQNLLHGVTHFFSKKSEVKRARATEHSPGAEEIKVWLVERVARQLGVRADELDVREPLANYGMDSRAALSLSGDLEEWLGRRHSPTLVWDYPTIEDIATHLAAENGAQQS